MSEKDVMVVISVFAEAGQGEEGRVEMGTMMRDDEVWERNSERFSSDVEVRFVTPGDKGVQIMEQEFRGIEGLREGWRVWMEPWEEFRVAMNDVVDAGNGRVLVLASAIGRTRGSGAEVPQEVATLGRVEEGQIVAIAFYLDQEQARRDAGLA